jgi:hypothetical protein
MPVHGNTFAFFQVFGTVPFIKERLNIVVITGARSITRSSSRTSIR